MKPILSYRLLESKPVDDKTERVRVAVSCTPACHGFLGVTMQFDVPAAVLSEVSSDGGKKGRKRGASESEPSMNTEARDKAIRERVAWKANQETHLGQDSKTRFAEADVKVEG